MFISDMYKLNFLTTPSQRLTVPLTCPRTRGLILKWTKVRDTQLIVFYACQSKAMKERWDNTNISVMVISTRKGCTCVLVKKELEPFKIAWAMMMVIEVSKTKFSLKYLGDLLTPFNDERYRKDFWDLKFLVKTKRIFLGLWKMPVFVWVAKKYSLGIVFFISLNQP